jgi:hypothetical protein
MPLYRIRSRRRVHLGMGKGPAPDTHFPALALVRVAAIDGSFICKIVCHVAFGKVEAAEYGAGD